MPREPEQKITVKEELEEELLESHMPRVTQVATEQEQPVELKTKTKKENELATNSFAFSNPGISMERQKIRTELEQSVAKTRGKYDKKQSSKSTGPIISDDYGIGESSVQTTTMLDRIVSWIAGAIKKLEQIFLSKLKKKEPEVVINQPENEEDLDELELQLLMQKKKRKAGKGPRQL